MKKRKLMFFLPLALLTLTGCSGSENIDVKSEEKDFYNNTTEYKITANKLNTYYINDSKIEYVDLKEFVHTLDGFLDYNSYNFSKVPFDSIYTMYYKTDSYRFRLYFDYNLDTISLNNYNALGNIVSTNDTDFMVGLKEDTSSLEATGGGETTWNLSGLFDLHYRDGKLYIPFMLANTILCSNNYYNVYYNGKAYNGYYTAFDPSSNQAIDAFSLDDSEHRLANFNLITFVMNNLYGLKDYKRVNDYSTILKDYKDDMLSTDFDTYSNAYKKFFMDYLDDPHTTYHITNKFEKITYGDYPFKDGNIKTQVTTGKELKALKESNEIKNSIDYYESTAIIHFDEFKTGTNNQVFDENKNVKDTAKDYDSYYFMLDAMKKIEAHGGIKNIMLDLTTSPGGNIAAMFRVLGFITNQDITITQFNRVGTLAVTEKMKVDTNLNGNFDDADAYIDYKWGVLTSNYTYSAANLFASIIKNQAICKIYGEKTGGGMCAVTPIVLGDASTVYISGTLAFVTRNDNNTFKYLEAGVEADTKVDRSNFYNFEEINKLFN